MNSSTYLRKFKMLNFAILVAMGSVATHDTFAQSTCVDPGLINPDIFCFDLYDPVCGCNGVTYSNACYAQNYGGVTSWTPGECGDACVTPPACVDVSSEAYIEVIADKPACCTTVWDDTCQSAYNELNDSCGGTPPCVDPSQVDPNMFCLDVYDPVCGCDGMTYSNDCYAFFYGGVTSWTEGECATSPVDPCTDLANIDFGLCDLFLGYALVNGECIGISGCSTIANGIDYADAIYPDPDSCAGCTACVDPDQIDPNMGCIDLYDPVCGCDGVTYSNDCYAFYYGGVTSWTEGECGSTPVDPCSDLAGIDFGPCDLFLGYALVNGECTGISGCTTVVAGIDYADAIYPDPDSCAGCNPCVDPDQIDPNFACIEIYDPVCGCDGVTYSNDCYAFYYGGVTSWTAGECSGSCEVDAGQVSTASQLTGLCQGDGFPDLVQLAVSGNAGIGRFGVARQADLEIVAVNTSGLFNFENLPAGNYFVGHLSVQDASQLQGLSNVSQLSGCYDLSNFLIVSTTKLNGGQLSTNSPTSLCTGNVTVQVSGSLGPNKRFVLLNGGATQILGQNQTGTFNFSNRPVGNYRIVHVAYTNAVDLSAIQPPNIPPCLAASNQILVTKTACAGGWIDVSPNPSSGLTWLSFGVASEGQATLEIYDMSGRKLAELFRQHAEKGLEYRVEYDGSALPNGVYLYRLSTVDDIVIGKAMIAR